MSSSCDLHFLIHSLAPAEKRYVRLFAARHLTQRNSHYLELYELLLKMPEYSEPELLAKLKTVERRKQLPGEKNYLYRFLLKALRSFHEESSVDISIKEQLINASLLYEKRLYTLSERELERARRSAVKFERWLVLPEILKLKAEIIIERDSPSKLEQLKKLDEECRLVLQNQFQLSALQRVHAKASAYLQLRHLLRDEQHRLEFEELGFELLPDAKHDSLLLLHYRESSKAMMAICRGNFDEAIVIYTALLSCWDAQEERRNEDALMYMKLLSGFLTACHGQNRFDLIPDLLARMRSIHCRTAEEKAEQFQHTYFIELVYRINNDQLDDFEYFAGEIQDGLTLFRTKINEARAIAFLYNMGVGFLLLENWKQALHCFQDLLSRTQTRHRHDLRITSRLLRLLLYFEIGKHELLEYELINTERFLRSQRALLPPETAIIRFLKKMLAIKQDEQPDAARKFIEKLSTLTAGRDSGVFPGSTEFRLWAQHLATGRSIRELMREENERNLLTVRATG